MDLLKLSSLLTQILELGNSFYLLAPDEFVSCVTSYMMDTRAQSADADISKLLPR